MAPQMEELRTVARSLRLQLQIHDIRTAGDLPAAFDAGAKKRAEALLTTVASIFVVHRAQVVELAARHKLPAMYDRSLFVDAGGLMAYGPDMADLQGRAATYVDKILKGAKPADLPVEQPTKFELAINRKTANELGLTIPHSLLLRADRVIE
jgi:putative tryptophan/tyrosine transport system substrate-binding protein